MAFQTLPTELILMIAQSLDQPALNALIQTCQLAYVLLNDILYVNNVQRNRGLALFWAASHGTIATAARMISLGADVRVRAESRAKISQCLEELKPWNRHANRSSRTTRQSRLIMNFSTCGETPLHRAAVHNQGAMVKYLLDCGADMMTIDTLGYFPIQLAAHRGHESIVNIFLERGFDPNTLGWSFFDATALQSAICGGHASLAKLLLEHGANANLTKSPAAIDPSPFDIAVSARIWEGFRRSWINNQRLTTLESSLGKANIIRGQEECAMLLMEHGADFETLDGCRYLIYATRLGFVNVVKALLERGASPNMRMKGDTALSAAQNRGFQELVDILRPITNPKGKKRRLGS